MIRRLAAAVMAVALLHLSVAAGDAACVEHDAMGGRHGATVPAEAVHRASVHDAHAGGDVAEQTPAPRCDAPIQPSCCDIAAGCSAIGLTSHVAPAPSALLHAVPGHDTSVDAPTSRRAAPEPPPPKR